MNRQYLEAAETLAANAVSSANIGKLVSCAAQANAACAQQFIGDFANRAFRGQLDSDESAALLQALQRRERPVHDFTTGIQAVITAVLTSPRFLFVLEFGQPARPARPSRSPRSRSPRGSRCSCGARCPTRR